MSKTIIFDFDGTLFYLYSHLNYDFTDLNNQVRELLLEHNIHFSKSQNIYEGFESIVENINKDNPEYKETSLRLEKIIVSLEDDVYKKAIPLPGSIGLLNRLHKLGYNIGIVSNNSVKCVQDVLYLHGIDFEVKIFGRIPGCPELMKPCSIGLNSLMKEFNAKVEDTTFVGDEWRDLLIAYKEGAKFLSIGGKIGYKKNFNDLYELGDFLGFE